MNYNAIFQILQKAKYTNLRFNEGSDICHALYKAQGTRQLRTGGHRTPRYKALAVLGAVLAGLSFGNIAIAEAAPQVSEDVYRWVQSTARTNYFFNRQQICFAVDEDGQVDTDKLIVPVLKTFDDVMINDVVSKRRWNGKSLKGFDDFVGVAEYLTFDLEEKKVSVDELDYLDSTWSTIGVERSEDAWVSLEELSDKSLDAKFYDRIIDFAMRNQLVLAERTKGRLSVEDRAELAEAQAAYRTANAPDRPSDNE